MSSQLQTKIKNFIDSHKTNVAAFERQAGLKTNVARNILRGQSKQPTGETLNAIAKAMGCTMDDLLNNTDTQILARASTASPIIEYPEILVDSLQCILDISKENKLSLTVQQILLMLGEVYTYSIKKSPPQVDADFVKWFLNYRRNG